MSTVRIPKFEERSQDETLRQERGARGNGWELAKSVHELKNKHKAIFFSSSDVGVFQHHPQENQRRENLLSDSGAPVHMLRRKDLNSADMDVRVSRNLQRS